MSHWALARLLCNTRRYSRDAPLAMLIFSLGMLAIAARCTTGLRGAALRDLRPNTNALRRVALQSSAADDAAGIYAIPERDVDEAAVQQLVERHVAQHATYLNKRPIAAHTRAAFKAAAEFARSREAALIIDAGCGTGRSTLKLAERYPDRTVIGVDRSEARLSKGRQVPDNALLLRAELGDFWRLLNDSKDLTVEETYLLYPNPYPKTKHLKLRFQGHASLPSLLNACGRKLTVRASWRTYLEEFRLACRKAGELGIRPDLVSKGPYELSDLRDPLTLFERKYAKAGVPVYELVLSCE